MKTIKENISNELVIKNSKFITLLYPKATHYCYAYIYNNYKKSSDDGEPTGTAGAPIMNVLEKEQLNNILVVVVRYFGGIKLGAGGLIRAYTKAVTEALKQALYQELISGYKVQIDFDYSQEKQLNYLLNDSIIIEKKYDEKITYLALIDKQALDKLHGYDYQILEELYIEKSINC